MEIIIKKTILKKTLALLVAIFLAINPVVFPAVIYAEGETTETTQTEAQPTPTPEPTATPTEESTSTSSDPTTTTSIEASPTPTPESTTTTGDAVSSAEVDTTANTNTDPFPGEVTTPGDSCTPPEGETSCPAPTEINNNNVAEVGDEATSSASTGANDVSGTAGDATIGTGDATAAGSIENELNSNTVILEPTPTVAPDPDGDSTSTASEESTSSSEAASANNETSEPALSIENNNQATAENSGQISASTGENTASENAGDASIETGDALAYGNIFNLINTNIVGSNFVIIVLNLVDQNGDIDLNKIWMEILGQEQGILSPVPENSQGLTISIENQNEADLENNISVQALSGQNEASGNGGQAIIVSGNATALANVVNLVNTNLIGSVFFFGVVNIFNSFSGNLILPRPERFMTNIPSADSEVASADASAQNGQGNFTNQNEAEIEGAIAASASTGQNQALDNTDGSQMETGDAQAAAQDFSLVNLNIERNNWFFLTVNNLGNWLGYMLGWSSPSAQEEQSDQSATYALGLQEQQEDLNGQLQEETSSSFPLEVINSNKAKVKNNVNALADTGQNEASGNDYSSIKTGRARALANIFNLVNLNILGGRWFMGVVNILGDWQGNAVFAYPDVQIAISDGQDQVKTGDFLEYTVSFQNQGYDEAQGVGVSLNLPPHSSYVSDTSGFTPSASGNNYTWTVGNIPQGMGGSFKIRVEVEENFTGEEEVSFWSKIIPRAFAAEEEFKGELVVNVAITTSDPESNTGNNQSSDANGVYAPKEENNFVDNPGEPKLEITAWNNVGEYVYPGDTVTFELIVKNTGSGPAYNAVASQFMYDGNPEGVGTVKFDLGTIQPGKRAKINFGLTLDPELPPSLYITVAKVKAEAPDGEKIASNLAETQFILRTKGFMPQVLAAETQQPQEGNTPQDMASPICVAANTERDWLPYILLVLLSTLWFMDYLKRKRHSGQLAHFFQTVSSKIKR